MPLYNGRTYVAAAIDSVLAQTSADWELLVIDDGSTDGGLELVKSTYSDPRIRLMANPRNYGVAYTRGVGIDQARGEYLAWIDCDDIMMPRRLELQLAYLRQHPDIGLCGTWIERFGSNDHSQARPPTDPELLRCLLLFTPIIPNATVMLRLQLVRQYDIGYDRSLPIAEDYDFVLQCSRHFQVGIVPHLLYRYRVTEDSLMQRYNGSEEDSYAVTKVVFGRSLASFGIEATESDLRAHRSLNTGQVFTDFAQYRRASEWLLRLIDHNNCIKQYDRAAFRRACTDRLYFISKKATRFGMRTLYFYVRTAVAHGLLYLSPLPLLKFFVRCLIRYDKF